MKSLSRVQLFVTPWTVAHHASLSMGFFRQEYWSGLPFPSPEDLPNPGIEPRFPALEAKCFTIWASREVFTPFQVAPKQSLASLGPIYVILNVLGSLGGFIKTQFVHLIFWISVSLGMSWSQGTCLFKRFPDNAYNHILRTIHVDSGLSRWFNGKDPAWRGCGFDPWVGKIPWRSKWLSIPIFLPGKSHGQRTLAGYNRWSHRRVGHERETTKQQQQLELLISFLEPFPYMWICKRGLLYIWACGGTSAMKRKRQDRDMAGNRRQFKKFWKSILSST